MSHEYNITQWISFNYGDCRVGGEPKKKFWDQHCWADPAYVFVENIFEIEKKKKFCSKYSITFELLFSCLHRWASLTQNLTS
jgi:hypothetical protein